MIKTWRARLNKRVGEAIFLAAQRDYVTGDLQRVTPATWVAHVIAALILTTPVLMLGAGLMLIYIGWPHLLALIVGAILIAVGWWLFPRRAKLPNGCLSREDLPDTFAMFDQISAGMNAPLITKLLLDDDFNAAVAVIRTERVLVIGALLWATLEDDQKIAVLAHEIGHLVNNDPTRSGFVGAALGTLEGWHEMFSPSRLISNDRYLEEENAPGIIGDLITGTLRTFVELIWSVLERINYLPQQRAEYLADALSAEIAGPTACVAALEQTELADRINLEAARLGSRNLPQGMAMITRLASAVTDASDTERADVREAMRAADHVVDSVHPPTAFRIAFIELLPIATATLSPDDIGFEQVNAELEPHLARIGTDIAHSLLVQ